MTRLLYLPDDTTIIQLETNFTPEELAAAINAGMRPLPILRSAPPGRLVCNVVGKNIVVAPAPRAGRPAKRAKDSDLTRRQKQVLELSTRGFTTEEISIMLGVSRRAVNYHLQQVRSRLRSEPASLKFQLETETEDSIT